MQNCGKLAGYTIFITGASRGIGKAVAIKAARDGANIVVAAKTDKPHPKLPGTIHTAVDDIVKAGGNAIACVVDVRKEDEVEAAVERAVKEFGGIDILINNASAISLTDTMSTSMKTYDLMNQINARGTYLCSKVCLPHLLKAKERGRNAHILNMSPPLSIEAGWFSQHCAYSIAKHGMSLCTLGMSAEFAEEKIAVNSLWPRTAIITAAVEMIAGGSKEVKSVCRTPEIMADASYAILIRNPTQCTGKFYIDEDVIREEGITDLDQYAVDPSKKLLDLVTPNPAWSNLVSVSQEKSKL